MIDRVRFTELLSAIVDNRGRTCPTAERGIALIATNCVKNSTLYPSFDKVRYVDEHTYATWFRGHPQPGDLIFVCKGAPGQVCLTPDPVPFCIAQDMVAIRANPKRVYPPYLFAALRSEEVQYDIGNMHVGTLIPHFKKGDFDKLFIPVPTFEAQRQIGDWYLTIERQIELNRRMNETLEAMAQAIFRDWFVDFGPVRRKLEGATDPVAIMGGLTADPTRAAELAALFPAALDEDTGLPAGWDESTLGEKTMAVLGGTPSRKVAEYWDGSIPWINSGAVNEFRITAPSELITEQGLSKSAAKLLPRRTTVLAITGATLGQVSLTEIETSANQSVVGLVHSGGLPPEFVYLWVKEVIDEIVARQTGGAQQHINKGNVEEQRVLTPPEDVLCAWSGLAVPLFDLVASGCFENRTLAETRDYLLPRLMSGAVRVGDTQSQDAAA